MIDFECPHCGMMLHVVDHYAGQEGACKNCGQRIRAPAAPRSQAPTSQSPFVPPMPPPLSGGAGVTAMHASVAARPGRPVMSSGPAALLGIVAGALAGVAPGGILGGILLSVCFPSLFAG